MFRELKSGEGVEQLKLCAIEILQKMNSDDFSTQGCSEVTLKSIILSVLHLGAKLTGERVDIYSELHLQNAQGRNHYADIVLDFVSPPMDRFTTQVPTPERSVVILELKYLRLPYARLSGGNSIESAKDAAKISRNDLEQKFFEWKKYNRSERMEVQMLAQFPGQPISWMDVQSELIKAEDALRKYKQIAESEYFRAPIHRCFTHALVGIVDDVFTALDRDLFTKRRNKPSRGVISRSSSYSNASVPTASTREGAASRRRR